MRCKAKRFIGLDHFGMAATKSAARNGVVLLQRVHLQNHFADRRFFLHDPRLRRCCPINLVPLHAARGVAVGVGHIGHRHIARITAPRLKILAARAKVAARGAFMGQGEVTGDRNQGPCVLICSGQRDRTKQGLRVGMAHIVKHLRHSAGFHRLARIHHAKPIADIHDQAQIVADKQHRRAVFLPQVFHQIDNPRFHRHIQRCGGFIQDQQRGF